MRVLAIVAAAMVGSLVTAPSATVAQTVPQATSRPASALESQPIFQQGRAPRAATANGPASRQPSQPTSLGVDLGRMFAALAIVLAIIGGVYWFARRLYGGAATAASTRAVKVLSRTTLAPRQQAMLIQVGRRVVLVGDSNGTLSQLAQITDADEVAELLGQIQGEQMRRAASFGSVFRRNQETFHEPADAPGAGETEHGPAAEDAAAGPTAPADEELARQRSELSGLLEKVRSLRGQIDR